MLDAAASEWLGDAQPLPGSSLGRATLLTGHLAAESGESFGVGWQAVFGRSAEVSHGEGAFGYTGCQVKRGKKVRWMMRVPEKNISGQNERSSSYAFFKSTENMS